MSPRFWTWPPITSVVHALERLSILVLVGASMFELISGLLNVAEWYPWKFFFPPVHYAIAWVAIGAIAVHIAVKLPVIRRALVRSEQPKEHDDEQQISADVHHHAPAAGGSLTRRGLLAAAVGAAAVVVVATVGDKIPVRNNQDLWMSVGTYLPVGPDNLRSKTGAGGRWLGRHVRC